jgi:hypothetical protein
LNAGCDIGDCSSYAAAFERDKVDESTLTDMKSDTLRALGLREGDIIRVLRYVRSSRQRPSTDKTRIWHDRSGQFRAEAEFKGMKNGKIRLLKRNGVTIEVPSEKMSPEDMRYIENVIRHSQTSS